MREVDVPLVDTNSCQNLLRATRLGANFALDSTSFMCAGGEAGKGKEKLVEVFTFTELSFASPLKTHAQATEGVH